MSKIEWDDSFSVNNIEIDDQHKRWIEIFNEMHESLITGNNTTRQTSEILKAMHEYTLKHFSFEEEYMRIIGYPHAIEHHRLHKDFDNRIFAYNKDIQEGKIVLSTYIIKLIKNWLLDHILIEDKKYAAYAENKT